MAYNLYGITRQFESFHDVTNQRKWRNIEISVN